MVLLLSNGIPITALFIMCLSVDSRSLMDPDRTGEETPNTGAVLNNDKVSTPPTKSRKRNTLAYNSSDIDAPSVLLKNISTTSSSAVKDEYTDEPKKSGFNAWSETITNVIIMTFLGGVIVKYLKLSKVVRDLRQAAHEAILNTHQNANRNRYNVDSESSGASSPILPRKTIACNQGKLISHHRLAMGTRAISDTLILQATHAAGQRYYTDSTDTDSSPQHSIASEDFQCDDIIEQEANGNATQCSCNLERGIALHPDEVTVEVEDVELNDDDNISDLDDGESVHLSEALDKNSCENIPSSPSEIKENMCQSRDEASEQIQFIDDDPLTEK